ncbi:hypothetical protein LINGRAHAP2_LOCUS8032 [Linum grandiflorum]
MFLSRSLISHVTRSVISADSVSTTPPRT